MFQAEAAYQKGYELRRAREAQEERLKYYRKACESFSKAFELDRRIFTLNRIYIAIESCMRVGDKEGEARFREFEELYVQQHPKEVEYGEAGFMIGIE